MSCLFEPVQLGGLTLKNRIVMAPLTRTRAASNRVPNELMRQYYCQRAAAGLIISEATSVSAQGVGYPNTPGIWCKSQIEGWKRITNTVHAHGGKMILQLWHVGRVSDPELLNGEIPVAPSAIACEGDVSTPHRGPCIKRKLQALLPILCRRRATHAKRALTAWKFMRPMGILSTSSCTIIQTAEQTIMAVRWRIGPAF